MPDTPSIEEVIAAVPAWAGRDVTAEPIPAGLTNRNYRVTVGDEIVFVRIPGADTELLAVDRVNELHNTRAAAAAGVGPRVRGAHIPAALTTTSVSIGPALVRTRRTSRCRPSSKPVTRTPCRIRIPRARAASATA